MDKNKLTKWLSEKTNCIIVNTTGEQIKNKEEFIILNKFDINKEYIFSKEMALKDKGVKEKYNNHSLTKAWIDYADSKIVKVIDEYSATLEYPIKTLILCPWWCIELNLKTSKIKEY